ncbi:MAG: site-specific integrase [Saprospiraceae bacterium]|nr:site-specific integrase [Saprospiraceae bacterium]
MPDSRPTVKHYHDTRNTYKKTKDIDRFPVKIRVSHYGQVKFYATGIDLTIDEYLKVMGKRPSPEFRHIKRSIDEMVVRFESLIESLPAFSFSKLENALKKPKKDQLNLEDAFNDKIESLKAEEKFSSASLYQSTIDCLVSYKGNKLMFQDIDTNFLNDWAKVISGSTKRIIRTKNGKDIVLSETTIGIYMRNLRHIFNQAIKDGVIHQSLYPFNNYKIPVSRNIKKALPVEHISKIYFTDMEMTERARLGIDLFVFSFATEGMNFKDILQLKKTDVDGNLLKFRRSKTKSTRREAAQQIVFLPELSRSIIEKYAKHNGPFLFPVLDESWSPEKIHNHIKWFITDSNAKLKEVARYEDLPDADKISTYFARHSYSTSTIKNGYSIEYLKEKLGHSSVKVTQNYIASFGLDIDKEASEKLLKGFTNE